MELKGMYKKILIPHSANNYAPHLLRHKRVWLYGIFLVAIKAIILVTVLLLPQEAWLSSDAFSRQADRMFFLANQLRAKQNLPVLKESDLLDRSAFLKAQDMGNIDYFGHTTPDGRNLSYYLQNVNYHYAFAGENLAVGYIDADTVMNAWKKSPAHYANLVDTDFTEVGFGIDTGNHDGQPAAYIVSHFGTPVLDQQPGLAINKSDTGVVAGEKISGASLVLSKYNAAKNIFSDWFLGEFEFSRYIYYVFFGIFALVLSGTILMEIKHQKPHLIINGMAILLLIFFLIKI